MNFRKKLNALSVRVGTFGWIHPSHYMHYNVSWPALLSACAYDSQHSNLSKILQLLCGNCWSILSKHTFCFCPQYDLDVCTSPHGYLYILKGLLQHRLSKQRWSLHLHLVYHIHGCPLNMIEQQSLLPSLEDVCSTWIDDSQTRNRE